MDLAAFIDRYDQAWNEQDVEAIMSMHTSDMVFENHTRAVRAEGAATLGRRRAVPRPRGGASADVVPVAA